MTRLDPTCNERLHTERRERRRNPAWSDQAAGYWDSVLEARIVKVMPGEHRLGDRADEWLATVLGSCVSACIRDPERGIGGLNHFMLPGAARSGWAGATNGMRYGHFAMEKLLNDLIKAGAARERLEIKLFGGANVLESSLKIGDTNVAFVRRYLQDERLAIAAEDLGGTWPRRILFNAVTGRVLRLELKRDTDRLVFAEEISLRRRLQARRVEGTVELFE